MAEPLIVPERWSDETIYSLVARIARLNGIENLDAIGQPMGISNPKSVYSCPVNIRHFCQTTKYLYGLPKDILQLTILPLMAHLSEVSQSDLTNIENGELKLELGALVFGLPKGNNWQICKECADREIKTYGITKKFASKPLARLLLIHLLFYNWDKCKEKCRIQEAFDDAESLA